MFAPIEPFCTIERVENVASKSGLQSLDEGIPPKYIHILFPQTYKCLGSRVSLFGKGVFTHVLEGFNTGPPWVMQVGEWQILLRLLAPFFSFLISPSVFDTKSCCSCSPARELWTHGPPSSAFKSWEHRCAPSRLAFVSKGTGKTHRAGEDNMRIVSDVGGIKLLAMEF